MTQSTLLETCLNNLQTTLLTQIRVTECRTWKQLVLQGEQAEEIIARIKAEEKESKSRQENQHDVPRPIFSIKKKKYSGNRDSIFGQILTS